MSDVKVWRIEEFRQGKYNIWPFEADFVEAYRTTTKHIFLDKKWEELHEKTDRGTEHDNVLRLGYLIGFDSVMGAHRDQELRKKLLFENTRLPDFPPGMDPEKSLSQEQIDKAYKFFLERTKEDEVIDPIESEGTHGVHFWLSKNNLSTSVYGGSLHLKVLLPTDGNLWIKKGDGQSNNPSVHNRREMVQFYSKKDLMKGSFQANYADDVPIEWIDGVYDHNITPINNGKSRWEDLPTYLQRLRKKKIFELEEIVSEIKLEGDIEQQLKFLNQISNELRKIQYYAREMNSQLNSAVERANSKVFVSAKSHKHYIGLLEEALSNILNILTGENVKGPGYIKVRRNLIEDLNKELGLQENRYSTSFNKGYDMEEMMHNENKIETYKEFLSSLQGLEQEVEEIVTECKSLAEEEKKRMRNETGKDVFNEEDFENRMDLRLTEDILHIPNMETAYEGIQKTIQKLESRRNSNLTTDEIKTDYLNGMLKARLGE